MRASNLIAAHRVRSGVGSDCARQLGGVVLLRSFNVAGRLRCGRAHGENDTRM